MSGGHTLLFVVFFHPASFRFFAQMSFGAGKKVALDDRRTSLPLLGLLAQKKKSRAHKRAARRKGAPVVVYTFFFPSALAISEANVLYKVFAIPLEADLEKQGAARKKDAPEEMEKDLKNKKRLKKETHFSNTSHADKSPPFLVDSPFPLFSGVLPMGIASR